MPWRHPAPIAQKTQFLADDQRDRRSITERCQRYPSSRQTGDPWSDRSVTDDLAGMDERARRPHTCPRQTPDAVVAASSEARRQHPTGGPSHGWPSHHTPAALALARMLPRRRDPKPQQSGSPDTSSPTHRPA